MSSTPFTPGAPDLREWLSSLDGALAGDGAGPQAELWRELRADVRALAPPIDGAFEQQLGDRLRAGARPPAPRRPLARAWGRLGSLSPAGLLAPIALLASLIAALLIASPWRGASTATPVHPATVRAAQAGASTGKSTASEAGAAAAAAPAVSAAPALAPATAPGRVQQVGASISLGPEPGQVQSVSAEVSSLAVRAGGYVVSSHVQVQSPGPSEASLTLRVPTASLARTLAAIGRLAPVRAQTQSLQDITGTYDSAHHRLGEALAERAALLRALAKAASEGEIDSLRERLSASRSAVGGAEAAVRAVDASAATSEVEVTLTGEAPPAAGGLTLHRALHDAGRVLVVALSVMLIAAAVLAPLALVLGALAAARGAWIRRRRDGVLGS